MKKCYKIIFNLNNKLQNQDCLMIMNKLQSSNVFEAKKMFDEPHYYWDISDEQLTIQSYAFFSKFISIQELKMEIQKVINTIEFFKEKQPTFNLINDESLCNF